MPDATAAIDPPAADIYPPRTMLRLTPHGLPQMVVGTLVLALLAAGLAWVWPPLALLPLPVFIWLLAFFRDPERAVPTEPNAYVSPADGMVSDITEIPHDELLGGPSVRIGIFLSVFNVHINRAPCAGVISAVTYKKGRFINALKHNEASAQNESNTVTLSDVASGKPVAVVRQIVGLIARTIVFPHKTGESVEKGQRIGMIKFGSRTELFIPARLRPEIRVKIGDKVNGAATIIATIAPAT